jgi:hypothetical protein
MLKGSLIRVVIDGKSRDMRSIDKALEYVRENWKPTSYVSISPFCPKNNLIREMR